MVNLHSAEKAIDIVHIAAPTAVKIIPSRTPDKPCKKDFSFLFQISFYLLSNSTYLRKAVLLRHQPCFLLYQTIQFLVEASKQMTRHAYALLMLHHFQRKQLYLFLGRCRQQCQQRISIMPTVVFRYLLCRDLDPQILDRFVNTEIQITKRKHSQHNYHETSM